MSTSLTTVVVDLLAYRISPAMIVPIEAKSGGVEEQQAKRYAAMTAADVRRLHTVPVELRAANVCPLVACTDANASKVRRGLEAMDLQFDLLVIGEGTATCEAPPERAFQVNVPAGPPPSIVRVDVDSPDEEYRELLLPEVLAAAARRETVVAIDTLLSKTVPFWGIYGRESARGALRKKAARVLKSLSDGAFRDDFVVDPGDNAVKGGTVRILRSPATHEPQGETQGWQALERRAGRTLRGKRPQKPSLPGHEPLFSYDSLVREIEDDDDA